MMRFDGLYGSLPCTQNTMTTWYHELEIGRSGYYAEVGTWWTHTHTRREIWILCTAINFYFYFLLQLSL